MKKSINPTKVNEMQDNTESLSEEVLLYSNRILESIRFCSRNQLKKLVDNETKRYPDWKENYKALINAGKNISDIKLADFRLLCMAIYNWMPSMYGHNDCKKLLKCIKLLSSTQITDIESITEIRSWFLSERHTNGSMSASSKLLHVVFPKIYPIWDSKVRESLMISDNHGNCPEHYFNYTTAMNYVSIIKQEELITFLKTYYDTVEEKVTTIRALEHWLYLYNTPP